MIVRDQCSNVIWPEAQSKEKKTKKSPSKEITKQKSNRFAGRKEWRYKIFIVLVLLLVIAVLVVEKEAEAVAATKEEDEKRQQQNAAKKEKDKKYVWWKKF